MALNCQLLLSESKQKVSNNLIYPKTKKKQFFTNGHNCDNSREHVSRECPVNFYFLFMTFEYGPSNHCSLILTYIYIYFKPGKIHNFAICSLITMRSSNKVLKVFTRIVTIVTLCDVKSFTNEFYQWGRKGKVMLHAGTTYNFWLTQD